MADDNSGLLKPIADVARQVTTPIAAKVAYGFFLTWLGSGIASSTMGEAWRGMLLLIVLALLATIVIASIVMSIKFPKHLTFDKDAHIGIDVNLRDTPMMATQLDPLLQDLLNAASDPDKLTEMAQRMQAADSIHNDECRSDSTSPSKT